MRNPEQILNELRRNPDSLASAFHNPLTFQEEFILSQIEKELGEKVHAMLDLALASGAEISLSQVEREQVMECTVFQKTILNLLRERGSLKGGRLSMN
ncbi:MAG TPA: hypothetical protein ENJ82_04820 [Bacteroidetes bacterium]|nr:hypothetical protein [Bacteroidota bacterium]